VRIESGERGRTVMPHSEVCMHMSVAGRAMLFELLESGHVQLLNDDGTVFSAPVSSGEGGVFSDTEGFYFHSHRSDARSN